MPEDSLISGVATPPAGSEGAFVPLPLPSEIEAAENAPQAPLDEAGTQALSKKFHDAKASGTLNDTLHPKGYETKTTGEAQDAIGNAATDIVDVGKGIAGGAEKGLKEGVKFAESVASGQLFAPADIRNSAGGKKVTEAIAADHKAIDSVPQVPAPETPAGQLASGISQFAVGMIGVGKFAKAAQFMQGMGKAATIARVAMEAGAAQAVVFDPHEERLSNFLEEHTSLARPITEFLAAKPDDTEAEGRLKNFLEGSVMGASAETLLMLVKGIRAVRSAKETGGEAAAAEETQKVTDQLAEPPRVADTAPPTEVDTGSGVTPPPKSPDRLAQEDADSIIKELKDQAEFPVDRITGLLNHEHIEGPGTMRQALELTAEKLAPLIEEKVGGVQTWKETSEIADALGVSSEELWANLHALSKDTKIQSGMVLAARRQMNGIATMIEKEARMLDNGLTTDRSRINSLIQGLAQMEQILLPIRTAQARGTRQWGLSADGVMSAQQIKAIIASGGDIMGITQVVRSAGLGMKILKAHNQLWFNGLFANYGTHEINFTSNLVQTVLRPMEKVLGGAAGEGFSQYMGIMKSAWASVRLAARSFRLEAPIADPRNAKFESEPQSLSPAAFGLNNKGIGETPVASALDWMAKALRLPQRFLSTSDEFFKQLNGRSVAYAKATQEAAQKGLSDADTAKYIEARSKEMLDGEGHIIDPSVLQESRLATFTQPLDPKGIVGGIDKLVREHPLLALVSPFIRISNNTMQWTAHHTPFVAQCLKSYRAEIAAGGGRAAAARGAMATGSMLWLYAIHKVMDGSVTGKGPADPKRRESMAGLTGWKPYSIKTQNGWVPYNRADPYFTVLGLAADFAEAHGYIEGSESEKIASAMGIALAQNLTSKTYARGITEVLDALSDPSRNAEKLLNSRAGSYIPGVLQQTARATGSGDDIMREVRSSMDALRARTPGLSETLAPRRNALGEPLHFPPGLGLDGVSAFMFSKDISDATRTELSRFGFTAPSPTINDGHIDLRKYSTPKGQDAHDRLGELTQFNRKGRYTFKERLDAEVNSETYQSLPQGDETYSSERYDRLRQIRGEYLEWNMRKLREEFPKLDKDIRADEYNKGAAKKQGPDALRALLGQQ